MNWLYTAAFVGILISNGFDESGGIVTRIERTEPPASAVVLKQDETVRFEQTYPFDANGVISVGNVNGSITVTAWDRDEINLVAVKTAKDRESLADVNFEVNADRGKFQVEANFGRGRTFRSTNGNLRVDFTLRVPRTAILDELETVNGSVNVAEVVTRTKISVVNGDVKAENLRGSARISIVNGRLNADFDQIDANSSITLDTVNGTANLSIPSDSNATLRADSLNGNIENDFGLPVRKGEYVGRDLHGRIGSGEGNIKLNSVNGNLSIKRRSDGRSLSPATDLLGTASPNRGVRRAGIAREKQLSANAEKDVAAAMAEAAEKMKALAEMDFKALAELKPGLDEKALEKQIESVVKERAAAIRKLRMINWTPGVPMLRTQEGSFPVKTQPKIVIDADECPVRVRGWNKNEVKYVVTEFTNRENSEPARVKSENNDGTVKIAVSSENNSGFGGRAGGVRLEVFVPEHSDLEVRTSGEIRLDGVTGKINLNGGDERIDVRDSGGQMILRSEDGRVRVIGFDGDIESSTVDGDIYLEGEFKNISAKTEDGDVMLALSPKFVGTISSSSEFNVDSLGFVRENNTTWRRGEGTNSIRVELSDGSLFIRDPKEIKLF